MTLSYIATKINEKLKRDGLGQTLYAILRAVKNKFLRESFAILNRHSRKENLTVFPDEDGITILLPSFKLIDLVSKKRSRLAKKCVDFNTRPNHEVLLRSLVFRLYESGILDKKKSIIDIGAWIGDNSIVWAKILDKDFAKVFAIDPSTENIEFSKMLCDLNHVGNISWHQKICSDKDGERVSFDGSIDHAVFNREGKGEKSLLFSSTIDTVIGINNHDSIGLFHVDVEGFEELVLRGALGVISQSKPVILYEQHISTEKMDGIVEFLEKMEYKIFMINEVLHGCQPDCRNFIAAPSTTDFSKIMSEELPLNTVGKYYGAIPGPCLIAIN